MKIRPTEYVPRHSIDRPSSPKGRRRFGAAVAAVALLPHPLALSVPIATNHALTPQPSINHVVAPTEGTPTVDEISRGLYDLMAVSSAVDDDTLGRPELRKIASSLENPIAREIIGSAIASSMLKDPPKDTWQFAKETRGLSDQNTEKAERLFEAAISQGALVNIWYGKAEPETMMKTGVLSSSAFQRAAQLVDATEALSDVDGPNSAKKAVQDIKETTLPEVQKAASAVFARQIATQYENGALTRAAARQAAQEEVTDATIRDLLRRYIDAGDGKVRSASREKLNLNADLHDLQKARDKAIAEITKPAIEMNERLKSKRGNDLIDLKASLDKQVEVRNSAIELHTLQPLQELSNAAASIDFTGVTSATILERGSVDSTGEQRRYYQFAEAYATSESVGLHFDATSNMSDETKRIVQGIYDEVSPLAEAAMKEGIMLNMRFVVDGTTSHASDDDFDPYWTPSGKEVVFVVPANNSVSIDMMRTTLTHELIHALIERAYEGVDVSASEVKQMKAACSSLSDEARKQFEISMKHSGFVLDDMVHTPGLTEAERAVIERFRGYTKNGTLNEHMTDRTATIEDFAEGCESPSLANVWADVANAVNADRQAKGLPKEGNADVAALITKLKDHEVYRPFSDTWNEAIRYNSLYAKLNEASHVNTKSHIKYRLGHSEDEESSGTELPASVLSALLTDTKYMKRLYAGVDEDDRKRIRQIIVATSDLIINRYPTLGPTITFVRQQVLTA